MYAVVANLTGVFQVANSLTGGEDLCEFKHSDKKNFLLFS
jgi:hypothetical protein